MQSALDKVAKRKRLAPGVRRAQIVSLAAGIALRQGSLPISLGELGEAAGASKALIYAYFPTQQELFNAVLAIEFDAMAGAGLMEAADGPELVAAALKCAEIYFERVATVGPIAHLILRDLYMRGRISAQIRAFRDRVARRLVRAAMRRWRLPSKEAVAVLNMTIAIPEEAGRLAHSGDCERNVGRDLVAQLVRSTLAAFAPAVGIGSPSDHLR